MKILALYSNKGGVGKTATTVNLSYLAAKSGLKTLICDLDPQGSTTYYFRVKPKLKREARGFAQKGQPINDSIKGTDFENLDLLPADFSHRNLDVIFNQFKRADRRLDKVIGALDEDYDLIVFDCPPSINILAENIFYVADMVLVPLIPTTLSARTHYQLLNFLKKSDYDLKKVYAFVSMLDRRKSLHRDLSQAFEQNFKRILPSAIPYATDVEKMGLQREPVEVFAPRSTAATAYQQLWKEVHEALF